MPQMSQNLQQPAAMPQNPQMMQPQMGMNSQMPQNMAGMPNMMQNPQAMQPQMGMNQNMNPQMPQGMNPGMNQNMNPQMPPQMPQNMQGMPNMMQNSQMMQPQMGMNPQMPQGMNPQMPEQPENPQNPMMMQQGMNPQMPQMGMMNQMQGMNMMGMMNPQMMGMSQPQFMGYDPNGTPIYMQMVPQVMGYDAYGNPMYTMVPMQTYGMPQMAPNMQGMPAMPNMMNPQMGMMNQNMPQQNMPAMPGVPQPSAAPPVQRTIQVSSFEDMPVSAESLMNEDENAEPSAPAAPVPNEKELLDQIFSDAPKQYSMSTGTKPSGQTFSINLSAGEVTSVADDEAKPGAAAPAPAPAPKKSKPAKPAAEQPVKKPQRIVSPDEFFGDSSSPAAKRMARMKVDTPMIEDDEQLEEQLAALEAEGHKKSKRSMQAADHNLDAAVSVENPAVAAAAQAIMQDAAAAVAALEKKAET